MLQEMHVEDTSVPPYNGSLEEYSLTRQAGEILERTFVWSSLGIGVPGNLVIILCFRTFPEMAITFMLQFMAGFDCLSILLLTSMRFLEWEGVVESNAGTIGVGWSIYFNASHFVAIFSNNVFILVVMERLIFIRFPDMISQYITMDRVKLNLSIFFILFASFCIVVVVKMTIFGVAWIFVLTIFYSIWPLLVVFLMLVLIISHYHNLHTERKKLERNKKLFPSQSSNVNKSPSKYSGISASGTGLGSLAGSGCSTSKKKNPYGSLLMNKSVSESYLASPSKLAPSISAGAINKTSPGKGMKSEVNLKVPLKGGSALYMTQSSQREVGSTSEEGGIDGEKDEMEGQITREVLSLTVYFIVLMIPVCIINILFIQENNEKLDPKKDDMFYLMLVLDSALRFSWHATKFFIFFTCSALFRRGILTIFRPRPRVLIENIEPAAV